MKRRYSISQKVFHPVLFGLTHDFDEVCKTTSLSHQQSSPELKKQLSQPVIEPKIYPEEDRQCPNQKKKNSPNKYQHDAGKKPGLCLTDVENCRTHILEEHLVCGYEKIGKTINQLVLGLKSNNGAIRYTGHVLLDGDELDTLVLASFPKAKAHPFSTTAFMSDNLIIWLKPELLCIIQCSEKNDSGLLITAIYRGLAHQRLLKSVLKKTKNQ